MAVDTPKPEKTSISWQKFIASTPANEVCDVEMKLSYVSSTLTGGKSYAFSAPDVTLDCSVCGGDRVFSSSEHTNLSSESSVARFIWYKCKNCEEHVKTYALSMGLAQPDKFTAMKYGQRPRFGVSVPRSIEKLLPAEDKILFEKALVAESNGLGIGAFTYYRRILDNQRSRIIFRVREAVEMIGGSQELLDELKGAQEERQFTKAVESIKQALPKSLYVEGHNPLTLLHDAVSNGMHAETDEDCLESARTTRTLLGHLLAKIDEALASDSEVKGAVVKLLKAKAKRQSTEQK